MPTAEHDELDEHDTAARASFLVVPPAGSGTVIAFHVPPDSTSSRACSCPSRSVTVPTATHDVLVSQSTFVSSLCGAATFAKAGSGTSTSLQEEWRSTSTN